jgi:hypothetical protein
MLPGEAQRSLPDSPLTYWVLIGVAVGVLVFIFTILPNLVSHTIGKRLIGLSLSFIGIEYRSAEHWDRPGNKWLISQ